MGPRTYRLCVCTKWTLYVWLVLPKLVRTQRQTRYLTILYLLWYSRTLPIFARIRCCQYQCSALQVIQENVNTRKQPTFRTYSMFARLFDLTFSEPPFSIWLKQ